jgi:hypothetical protein
MLAGDGDGTDDSLPLGAFKMRQLVVNDLKADSSEGYFFHSVSLSVGSFWQSSHD